MQNCCYRAYSKTHFQIHIKNEHTQDPYTEILNYDFVELPDIPQKRLVLMNTLILPGHTFIHLISVIKEPMI